MTTATLCPPTTELHGSWLESWAEWGSADQDGASVFFAAKFGWDLHSPQGFAQWVELLNELGRPGAVPPEGFAPQSTLWLERDGEYLGAVSLRHTLMNEFLQEVGGHIGYGVRPSARGQGLAKLALAGALDEARGMGLQRVLVTCNDSNIASARTIEACGGKLERIVPAAEIAQRFGAVEDLRRYWIAV
ncbi:GNAT family N-acetyltransferase [Glutamicibacter sp. NPDC087344]|uniref:GNAT family N-acetyltransferase n=1 Tax=Glutamicibacter sp. NPDC087344 TaxID=3363994 RepID=UPI0038268A89